MKGNSNVESLLAGLIIDEIFKAGLITHETAERAKENFLMKQRKRGGGGAGEAA